MKSQTLKPLLTRINDQLADILKKYETGQKEIAFDTSPAFDRFLKFSEMFLPIISQLSKPDFNKFNRLIIEFEKVTKLVLNNPIFGTCFIELTTFDQAVKAKFEANFSPFSINSRWEEGYPFNLYMVTSEIPNFTANTFQKMFCQVQTIENPQIEIIHQKHPKHGFDRFIELPGENHNLMQQFKAARPQNQIEDYLRLAEFQFIEFCKQSILKTRQVLTHQEQILDLCSLQEPKAPPKSKKATPPTGFDCSLTNSQLKRLCFALSKNDRFIDSETDPDNFIAAFRPEPLPDGFEKIRWIPDITEYTYLITDALRSFVKQPKQVWKQTDLVFSDENGNPLKNLRQAQNNRLTNYPEIDRIVEKILL